MITNKHLFDECELVLDENLEEATDIASKMKQYAKDNKLYCLSANQVGYNRQLCIVRDDDGFFSYINPEFEEIQIEDSVVQISRETVEYEASIISLPRKKIVIPVQDTIRINAFCLEQDERVSFTIDGELAMIWQTILYIMNGVNEEDVVACDHMTIKNIGKKRPNDKCNGCGKKNKKCLC
jgi:peptide deformylase